MIELMKHESSQILRKWWAYHW